MMQQRTETVLVKSFTSRLVKIDIHDVFGDKSVFRLDMKHPIGGADWTLGTEMSKANLAMMLGVLSLNLEDQVL